MQTVVQQPRLSFSIASAQVNTNILLRRILSNPRPHSFSQGQRGVQNRRQHLRQVYPYSLSHSGQHLLLPPGLEDRRESCFHRGYFVHWFVLLSFPSDLSLLFSPFSLHGLTDSPPLSLLSAGCGRFFEGTAAEMNSSLKKLVSGVLFSPSHSSRPSSSLSHTSLSLLRAKQMLLPDETLVYTGHEYTHGSAKFGKFFRLPSLPSFVAQN